MTDFLLLNVGNYPANLIFPYAFVQVRAVAKRHGISCATYDLHGIPITDYRDVIKQLVRRYSPRMIGLHIRQADSIFIKDYLQTETLKSAYFPLLNAQEMIVCIREELDVPVVLGGFGFTTYIEPILRMLMPDFGIIGEPDDLFEQFDNVLKGELSKVRNAVWLEGRELIRNERYFFPPLNCPEYDDDVLGDMEKFYSRAVLYGPQQPTIAVELARGCPFSCYFCSEPHVKGRDVRQRDLDVVMADVEFLVQRGIRRFWLICSEINIGNNELALRVAAHFRNLNERYAPWKITWQAYHLPRWLSRDDLQMMYDSGFDGGWNDFPSLDTRNLVDCRVPYREQDVVFHLVAKSQIRPSGPNGVPPYLSLFLGNSFATPETFANTLKNLYAAGLGSKYPSAEIGMATRLFPFHLVDKGYSPPGTCDAFSVAPGGPAAEVDITLPTFYFSPSIRNEFETREQMFEFFYYVASTLLSNEYAKQLDWKGFYYRSLKNPWFKSFLSDRIQNNLEKGKEDTTKELVLEASETRSDLFNSTLVKFNLKPIADALPYCVMLQLLPLYSSESDFYEDLQNRFDIRQSSKEGWLFNYYLFRLNIRLRTEYKKFIAY
jgi:hypothetical protein